MRSSALSLLFAAGSTALSSAILAEPASFQANPKAGGGGASFKDSPRFRVYNCSDAGASQAIKLLEAAYECMVGEMGWRSSGLSFKLPTEQTTGPYYKMNVYCVPNPSAIGGAAGVMGSDFGSGHAFVKVVSNSIGQAQVTVHEYGHALTYYEKTWVDQGRTGTWWEPLANFVCSECNCKISEQHANIVVLMTGCGSFHNITILRRSASKSRDRSRPVEHRLE